MVGIAGSGPYRVVHVEATNPSIARLGMTRHVGLQPRKDGRDWAVGDEIGFIDGKWSEMEPRAFLPATISKVLDDE